MSVQHILMSKYSNAFLSKFEIPVLDIPNEKCFNSKKETNLFEVTFYIKGLFIMPISLSKTDFKCFGAQIAASSV